MSERTPVVDSHHHFWDLSKFTYFWMPPGDNVVRRNYLPDDLLPLLQQAGVDRTVLVHALPSTQETYWLLELAEQADFVAGVVGWVDLKDPRLGDTLDRLQQNPYFKGARHGWHHEADPAWHLQPDLINGLKEFASRGLALDLLLRPPHIKYVPETMDKVPGLRVVINHIAEPNIAEHQLEPWLSDLQRVAGVTDVKCKVSGMVTKADRASWSVDDVQPYVTHVLEMFGYDRLMYGSDWPVCVQAGSYDQVIGVARETLSSLTEEQSEVVFGGNAIQFYELDF